MIVMNRSSDETSGHFLLAALLSTGSTFLADPPSSSCFFRSLYSAFFFANNAFCSGDNNFLDSLLRCASLAFISAFISPFNAFLDSLLRCASLAFISALFSSVRPALYSDIRKVALILVLFFRSITRNLYASSSSGDLNRLM